jgi:dihydrodipicolinate synthase/N-acetylneuraminate lyase
MTSSTARTEYFQKVFPEGVPHLWCPPLSHFSAANTFDAERIEKHLAVISSEVGGVLIPGSTGEGWEMSDEVMLQLLDIVIPIAKRLKLSILVGILKPDLETMHRSVEVVLNHLKIQRDQLLEQLLEKQIVGFTFCPPQGKDLSQAELLVAMQSLLERGLPTALYQLPQVTKNELSPETVQSLAQQYPNFVFFKDTSGSDHVAESGLDLHGVMLLRGAEGGYSRWPKFAGGPYDGFLLSTANGFASELGQILKFTESGDLQDADSIAERISRIVKGTFDLVSAFPTGNAFTNANKVIDHIQAYGRKAVGTEPPLLIGRTRLPAEWIQMTCSLFEHEGMFRPRGYLDDED